MTLSILVVDDEPLARQSVVRHLRTFEPAARIDEAADGVEALEQIARTRPDVVFLDVEMPELSGLDVLAQLPAPRPKIVFVTAYAHFAVRAFEENACDYLLKPFTPERLRSSLERVRSELGDTKLAGLERSLAADRHYLERLALPVRGRIDVVPVAEIECLRSEGRHTYVHTASTEHVSELSLIHFEERLDPSAFVRVHRTALVGVAHLVEVVLGEDAVVVLRSGRRVAASRRNLKGLRRWARP